MSVANRFRPELEALGARITPSNIIFEYDQPFFVQGVLLVAPSAAQAPTQTVSINRQLAENRLPDGDVLPGHGLKTAEAHTPVVTWTPT